jgi:PadR family transcriptional regulator, regulatory protein PadR
MPGWSYGYDLSRVTSLKSGTLYPMLARLAERGLLETAWEQAPPPGRPARHLYRLSADGAELAGSLPPEFATPPRGRWTVAGTTQA